MERVKLVAVVFDPPKNDWKVLNDGTLSAGFSEAWLALVEAVRICKKEESLLLSSDPTEGRTMAWEFKAERKDSDFPCVPFELTLI